MNIAYICADFGVPIFGFKGASIHLREMVNAWRKSGHCVHILSPAMHKGKGDDRHSNLGETATLEIPEEDLALFAIRAQSSAPPVGSVDFLPVVSEAHHLRLYAELDQWDKLRGAKARIKQELRNILYSLTLLHAGAAYLSDKGIDFVYERYTLLSLAGLRLARRLGVPHLLEVNAPLTYEQERMRGLEMKSLARQVESEIFRETDCVLVVSEALKEFVASCKVPEEKIVVQPNAVDPCRFSPEVQGDAVRKRHNLHGKLVVGFVGSLKPWHGVESLLQAFRPLVASDNRWHLLLVGDGPARESLQHYVQSNGFADAVTFTGRVHYDDIPAHIAAMDITVAPYTPNDHFYFSPIKIFEYMAMGKAVVAGRLGQIPHIIREGESGLLFTPGNVDELTAALEQLRQDPSLRLRIGEAARMQVYKENTWERNAERVLDCARRLLQPGATAKEPRP